MFLLYAVLLLTLYRFFSEVFNNFFNGSFNEFSNTFFNGFFNVSLGVICLYRSLAAEGAAAVLRPRVHGGRRVQGFLQVFFSVFERGDAPHDRERHGRASFADGEASSFRWLHAKGNTNTFYEIYNADSASLRSSRVTGERERYYCPLHIPVVWSIRRFFLYIADFESLSFAHRRGRFDD